MKNLEGLKLVTRGEREIVMTRELNAPRRLVFHAFTKPELVKRWNAIVAACNRLSRCLRCVGGYITARLAPDRPMRHALAGGIVGFVACTVGAVVTWNRGPAFGPHWYPLALVATAVPCAWLGGQLRVRQFGQSDGRLQQR